MKLTIQKILICALSLIISIAACVCGMYMTILAHMQMMYRIIFCLFFLLNPVLSIFMIRFMFKKPVPKEETDGAAEPEKKKKWGFSKKDEQEPAATEIEPEAEPDAATASYSDSSYTDSAYDNSGYSMPAEAENTGVTASVSENADTQTGPSSFAGEWNDDIDYAEPVTEKSAGSVTEDSVAKFKKISLKRKKRADE